MNKYIFIIILFTISANAQQAIFKKPIQKNSLLKENLISDDLNSTYLRTDYFLQEKFDLKQDLILNLPNNQIVEAIYTKEYRYSTGTYSVFYKIKDDFDGQLVLSNSDNVITGMYVSGENKKTVFQQTSSTIFALSEVNEESLIEKEKTLDYIIENNLNNQKSVLANNNVCLQTTPECSGISKIDVMVVYSFAAMSLWGSQAIANSTITSAVTNMNVALINSGITNVSFNLVYSGMVNYVETGDYQMDLNSLKSTTDGVLDEIHIMRTNYGADLVGLILGSPTSTCGRGNLNTSPTNYLSTQAFVVNLYSCVLSNFSLAHEFGHNMGLNHDWYENQNSFPCSHHHGYVNRTAILNGTTSTTSQRWRTIMAYNNECADIGISCARINRWANPSVSYNSQSTGIAIGQPNPSDEAFAIKRVACVVSNFKPTVLSTNEFIEIPFSIYPNPIKNSISVICDLEIDYIKIYNSLGQFVISSKEKTINTELLSKGVYFVKIYGKQGKSLGVRKVVKQ